ncbi:protein NDNF isoform X2 [Ctenocephalides felis]|uniref:protein NDNF isoform X2 n=1 Tax=Ctenocephalides felis TaxID=7515 RepID=UPI000E6E5658|nr:protein NDNF isoform X2 [Ctenocephalides felis]
MDSKHFCLLLVFLLDMLDLVRNNDVCNEKSVSESIPVFILHAEKQESISLQRCVEQRLEFSLQADSSLSFTITPCTSNIAWSVEYRNSSTHDVLHENTTRHSDSLVRSRAPRGLYTVRVKALESATRVLVYTTVRDGGPPWLQARPAAVTLRMKRGGKRRGIRVRWNASNYNPYASHYWLVVNSERSSPTLCLTQDDRLLGGRNTTVPTTALKRKGQRNKVGRLGRRSKSILSHNKPQVLVLSLGNQTKYDLPYIPNPGQRYYFDVFAHDAVHDVMYRYGGVDRSFERPRPQTLHDGKNVIIRTKKVDGPLVFRYKVPRAAKEGSHIAMRLSSCGCCTRVTVQRQGTEGGKAKRHVFTVDAHRAARIHSVKPGQRYTIRVAFDPKVLRNEIWLSSLGKLSPLPDMPETQDVREFPELRTCSNVTIRWLPSPDSRPCTYCVLIVESPKTSYDMPLNPNQCQLNQSFTRKARFAAKYCTIETNRTTAMVRSIPHLENGKLFTIQVTAQIGNGRILAYKLLRVQTAAKCHTQESTWN